MKDTPYLKGSFQYCLLIYLILFIPYSRDFIFTSLGGHDLNEIRLPLTVAIMVLLVMTIQSIIYITLFVYTLFKRLLFKNL